MMSEDRLVLPEKEAVYEEAIREQLSSPSKKSVYETTLAEERRRNDPSGHMKGYLKAESKEMVIQMKNASEALVRGSKVEMGVQVTARRFAAAESHIDGTAVLLRKMNQTVKQLDDEVSTFVESVTLLEDVAAQLDEVNSDALKLFHETPQ